MRGSPEVVAIRLLIAALLLGLPVAAAADNRWADALAAFAAEDSRSPPPAGGVLFVGSSSIRLWDGLEKQWGAGTPVIKRGFGGSRLADCVQHLDRLVIAYRPRVVVVYAGDNDLAEGGTPQEVLQRFAKLADGIHERLPGTRVAFISIKPSPARRALIERALEANQLVRDYVAGRPELDYIDVFARMLDAEGRPRTDLFLRDGLHLNAEGYRLWASVISSHLR